MPISSAIGWAAFALVPAAAVAGWVLRRHRRGGFITRMRPHFFIGYGALALATLHLLLSTGGMGGANGNGIWLATFALGGVAVQAFLGTNLQSPGGYRRPLHRWHVLTFWTVLALIAGHVVLNSSFITSAMGQ